MRFILVAATVLALALLAPSASALSPKDLVGNWLCRVEITTRSDGRTRKQIVRYRVNFTDVGVERKWVSGLYSAMLKTEWLDATAVGEAKVRLSDGNYDVSFRRPDRVTDCQGEDEDDCKLVHVYFSNVFMGGPSDEPGYTGSVVVDQNTIDGESEDRQADSHTTGRLSCQRTEG